ncbi:MULTISPECIES: DivIVA domain-containing protein [unclassified Micromonospora]|uniref:DivIVA domain-containing protein n=1 Tax=unclassified Micromonospora TaxID=2617518 RepID=UPI0010441E5F|nr:MULTISPECIES: DivIVA domain-containing protein [unclassified Micromonospora]TDB78245.1 DivIVA domain-containing protein [Micromonospora sp. KC721]TDC40512.1 DivIVA domain-containing protein [Micromonospora sp. KC213]
MRVPFRRPGRNQRPEGAHRPDGAYRSSAYLPLLPWQVRQRRFRPARFGRRGLDPDEVQAFLDRVAGDLDAVYQALRESRLETARIKDALRRWQSEQARRINAGRW